MSRHPSSQYLHAAQSWRRRVRAAGFGTRVARYVGPCRSGLNWIAPFGIDPRLAVWFVASGWLVDADLGVAWLEI